MNRTVAGGRAEADVLARGRKEVRWRQGAGRGLPPLSRVPAAARNRVESFRAWFFRAAPTHLRPPYSTQFPKRSIPTSPSPRAACCTKNPLPGARGRHCPRRQGNIAFTFGRSRKKAPSVLPSNDRAIFAADDCASRRALFFPLLSLRRPCFAWRLQPCRPSTPPPLRRIVANRAPFAYGLGRAEEGRTAVPRSVGSVWLGGGEAAFPSVMATFMVPFLPSSSSRSGERGRAGGRRKRARERERGSRSRTGIRRALSCCC